MTDCIEGCTLRGQHKTNCATRDTGHGEEPR
jgi:hypothetical protein